MNKRIIIGALAAAVSLPATRPSGVGSTLVHAGPSAGCITIIVLNAPHRKTWAGQD